MVLSLASPASLFLLCLLFFLLHSPPVAADPLYKLCGNTTASSTYKSNLNRLPSLLSNASLSNGFSNFVVGQAPDQLFGLALCRGDVNASLCLSCLNTASHDIVQLCPDRIEAVVWYDPCLLRYSNQWYLASTKESKEILIMYNVNNITDRPLFNKRLNELLSALANLAANNTIKRFATGEMYNFTMASPKIYGLVQCTPDQFGDTCYKCLQDIFDEILQLFSDKQGGRVLRVYCNFRYEIYPFYYGESMLKLGSPAPLPASQVPPLVKPPAPLVPPLVNPPALPAANPGNKKNVVLLKIAIPLVSSSLLIISITFICFWTRRTSTKNSLLDEAKPEEITHTESLLLDLSMLRAATANFSEENKLGVGGFGAVYKGTLPNGQEFAAKRLSATSRQGLAELKNELVLVAKLRHKNLVRLLGVCLEEQEKLLVYEYVPNRSLDTILFDPIKREQLHWERRHKIIRGIARGLLYLHEDSQLKVIHRDLKAGNVLLDEDMNPKISDFGLARLFGGDQSQSITTRVVGTFGYMAPEYVIHGKFSVKSDVYSYGVLVLEIITGNKNSSFSNSDSGKYLLTYVWEQWNKGTILEILDSCLGNHCPKTEVLRCIQIGLLCVQENPSDRPDMSTVVMMLNSDAVSIQAPSRPAFFIGQSVMGSYAHSNDWLIPRSLNEVSNTELVPR